MPHLGVPELVIILVLVVLVFGVGRLASVGGALGKGISDFKRATTREYGKSQESEQN